MALLRLSEQAHEFTPDAHFSNKEYEPPLPPFARVDKAADRLALFFNEELHGLAGLFIPKTPRAEFIEGDRISLLGSVAAVGTATARIFHSLMGPFYDKSSGLIRKPAATDVDVFARAMNLAVHQQPLCSSLEGDYSVGQHEVLDGCAGLLWAALNLRWLITKHRFSDDEEMCKSLRPLFGEVPDLAQAIVEAGKKGAGLYEQLNKESAPLPLMWPWINNYFSLGT